MKRTLEKHTDTTSYSVGRKASLADDASKPGIFRSVPLPGHRTMKVLDREVFEKAVRAAANARKSR